MKSVFKCPLYMIDLTHIYSLGLSSNAQTVSPPTDRNIDGEPHFLVISCLLLQAVVFVGSII